jgi:hypothetical protein
VSSEVAVKPLPRRGRLWIILVLGLGLFGLGYTIVKLSTQAPGDPVVHVEGIEEAQRIFSGIPQEGDRLGSDDAPVTIQVFNDLQCDNCREDFLSTIPALAERYARPGDVKLLYRHYSNSIQPEQLGFYGAEAAADQGYGWQYIYLFFRNQDEAERFGVKQELRSRARWRSSNSKNGMNTSKKTVSRTARSTNGWKATRNSARTSKSAPARGWSSPAPRAR